MKIDRRTMMLGAASLAVVKNSQGAEPTKGKERMSTSRERVLGIGGLFFRSRDPKKLTQWYQDHLGIDQPSWQQAAGPTAFNPAPENTDYFGSPKQGWMINFRVRNLEAMAAQLQKSGIDVKIDPEKYPYGRFARLHDPEGNPIELWEPMNPD
jgi:glyoxylase I family protein